MSRRTDSMAAAAAQQASEAARVLQQRSQEARQESRQPAKTEASPEPEVTNLRPHKPRDPDDPAPRVSQRTVRDGIMAEIEERQRKNSGWRRVDFEDGPDGQKRAVVKDGDVELPKVEEEKPEKATQEAKETAKAAAETTAPAEAPAAPAETPAESVAPKMVKVKVDGEVSDVPEDEVTAAGGVAAYQIQKSSENRLKQANAALAEAKRLQSALMEQAARALAPAAPPPPPEEPIDKFIAGKVDTIRFGTPEESAAALQEILQKAQGAKVDPSQIIEQAIARIRHDQIVSAVENEFQDVLENPMMKKLFVNEARDRLMARQKSGDTSPVDFGKFYRTIGTELRNLIGRPHQPPKVPEATTGTTSQAPSDKEARKASIVNLPTATARAEAPKEEKPESREDVIAQMKRSRGILTG